MIKKGSLVRYTGVEKTYKSERLFTDKLLSVHAVEGDKAVVWHGRKKNGEFDTITLSIKDLEEVC